MCISISSGTSKEAACSISSRKNRLTYARGYQPEKIDEIMAAQLPKEEFLKNCDRVIDNNGVFVETMLQLDKIVHDL